MDSQADDLKKQYQLRFGKLEAYRRSVWRILCDDFFSRQIPKDATVLDIGAGWGEFINNITAAKKFAMDLNPDTAGLLSEDVEFLRQDCSQTWPVAEDSLDVVFTSNFLEHLPDKSGVERTISEVHRCLKPGGIIICMGPNANCIPGAYWDFWDHYVCITEQSLSELLKMKGFGINLCIRRFLPYSMSTGSTPPLIFLRLYLKMRLAWPVFGRQFLVVGRKGSS